MTVEYRDDTPFVGDNHTLTELANAIRTKKKGKDVREPIAQAIEKLTGITNKIDNFDKNLRETFDIDADYVPLPLTLGSYINGLEDLVTISIDDRAVRSSKINVSEGEIYFVYSRNFWNGQCVILVNDNNEVVAKFPNVIDDNIYHLEVKIPSEVTGMYINSYNTNTPFVSKFKNYVAKRTVDIIEVTSSFVFSPINYAEKQGYFWSVEQGLKADDRGVTIEVPLKVTPGEIYRVSGRNFYQGKLFLIFDEKRNLVSGFEQNDDLFYDNITFQIPVKGQFLVITGYGTAPKLEKWTGYSRRKWEAIGDSWTAKDTLGASVKNYTDYVSEKLELTVINKGVGGSGFWADNDGQTTSFVTRKYSNDADVYTFFGSFNDAYVSGKTLGEISDYSNDTLYGAIKLAINSIISVNSKAKIGLIAPAPWGGINPQNNHNLIAFNIPANEFAEKYVQAIKEVSELYSLPFLDLYHQSGLRPYDTNFIEYYYHGTSEVDVTHPNTEGHAFFSPQIESFLRKIL